MSGLMGATGGGLAGYKMNRRVQDIREFAFRPVDGADRDRDSMLVTICVTGWSPGGHPRPGRV